MVLAMGSGLEHLLTLIHFHFRIRSFDGFFNRESSNCDSIHITSRLITNTTAK
jgi:hypothetical protein